MDKAAKEKSYWERSKGLSGMLSNPLLQGGLGILGANGNQWAGGILGGLETANRYRTAEEEREEEKKIREAAAERQAIQDGYVAEDRQFLNEDRDRKEQQIAMLTGGGDQQLAQQSPVDTRTADISGGLFGGMNPQQSPAQSQVGGILGAQPDIQQMIQARALTDPEGASQMAMQYSMQQQQAQAAQEQRAADIARADALQATKFGREDQRFSQSQAAAQAVAIEKAKAEEDKYQRTLKRDDRQLESKQAAKDIEKQKKAQNTLAGINESEKLLVNMMNDENFAGAVGPIDSITGKVGEWMGTDQGVLGAQVERVSNKMVIDLISSASFGALSEGERQFLRESVPTRGSSPKTWKKWYEDEYIPSKRKVEQAAGVEPTTSGGFGGDSSGFYTEKQSSLMSKYRGN